MADGTSKGYFGGMSMTGDQIRSLRPALGALLSLASSDIGSAHELPCSSSPRKRNGFGGKNPQITFEQVARVIHALTSSAWYRKGLLDSLSSQCSYYQHRNDASYRSRKKKAIERERYDTS